MKFSFAFVSVSLLLSVPASAAGDLDIVDVTGQFDRFVMATADMPDGQRIRAFEKQIGPIADGFYARDRNPDGYDLRVLAELKTYPQRRDATLTAARQFKERFAPARQHFEAVFGPVTSREPVFILDSLGELDGGTRDLGGGSTLLFGADVIAEVHNDKDLTAFFYHELFHLYRQSRATDCVAIWCSLWEEGMAAYVSKRLDPSANDDELILNLPEPIRPLVEANRGKAICEIVRRLDSTTDEDFNALFQGDDHLPGFPARMGYYVGYLVAADAGRTHDLRDLANMGFVEARPLIDAALSRMATCPTATMAEASERSRTHRTRS